MFLKVPIHSVYLFSWQSYKCIYVFAVVQISKLELNISYQRKASKANKKNETKCRRLRKSLTTNYKDLNGIYSSVFIWLEYSPPEPNRTEPNQISFLYLFSRPYVCCDYDNKIEETLSFPCTSYSCLGIITKLHCFLFLFIFSPFYFILLILNYFFLSIKSVSIEIPDRFSFHFYFLLDWKVSPTELRIIIRCESYRVIISLVQKKNEEKKMVKCFVQEDRMRIEVWWIIWKHSWAQIQFKTVELFAWASNIKPCLFKYNVHNGKHIHLYCVYGE